MYLFKGIILTQNNWGWGIITLLSLSVPLFPSVSLSLFPGPPVFLKVLPWHQRYRNTPRHQENPNIRYTRVQHEYFKDGRKSENIAVDLKVHSVRIKTLKKELKLSRLKTSLSQGSKAPGVNNTNIPLMLELPFHTANCTAEQAN